MKEYIYIAYECVIYTYALLFQDEALENLDNVETNTAKRPSSGNTQQNSSKMLKKDKLSNCNNKIQEISSDITDEDKLRAVKLKDEVMSDYRLCIIYLLFFSFLQNSYLYL